MRELMKEFCGLVLLKKIRKDRNVRRKDDKTESVDPLIVTRKRILLGGFVSRPRRVIVYDSWEPSAISMMGELYNFMIDDAASRRQ